MSAAIAPGTPAAANPAAPAARPDAASSGLDAVLGDLSADETPIEDNGDSALEALTRGPENETDAAADAEPDEAAPEAPKAQPNLDELLFSDEALSTKEGVVKARNRLRELQRKGYEAYLQTKRFNARVQKKTEKLKVSVDNFKREKTNHDLLLGNVRSNLQGLHSNDPDTILTALGNLTGQDGLKAYELLTSRIVNRGQSKLDPQVQQVLDAQRAEIEQLKLGLTQRAEQERKQQLDAKISQHERSLQQQVLASTATPHLARIMRDDPERLTKVIVNAIEERNGNIAPAQLFAEMESEIQAKLGIAAPQGDIGTSPAPKLAQAQRSPGQSVGPSRAAAAQTPREPTEAESLRALADDPALMSLLGF